MPSQERVVLSQQMAALEVYGAELVQMLRSELAVLLGQLPDLEPVDTAEAIAALVELATGDVSGRGAAAAGAAAGSLGVIGQRLLASGAGEEATTALVLPIAECLVALMCVGSPDGEAGLPEFGDGGDEDGGDDGEEGGGEAARASGIRLNAAFGLLRLCTVAAHGPASVVAARPPAQDCAGGPVAEITAGLVAEARARLERSCGAADAEVAPSLRALSRALDRADWPWGGLGAGLFGAL